MRSSRVTPNTVGTPSEWNALHEDARGASRLLAHQMYGTIALPTNPTNGQTLTLDINGTNIVVTFVSSIGTSAGNVLIAASATATAANLLQLLLNPTITNSTQVAIGANTSANVTFVNYIAWSLVGTSIIPSSNAFSLYTPDTSFSASTTVTGGSYTPNTLALFIEPGVVYVNGTEVYFAGGVTPTITAPVSHPRIDVLTINSSGTLAWMTGTEGASPSTPAYPANQIPICELYNVVGETALYDQSNAQNGQGYIQNDVRPFLSTGINLGAVPDSIIPSADGTYNLGSPSFEWNNLYVKSGIFLNGVSINALMLSSLTAGASITTGQPVSVYPYQTDGGILLDTSGNASAATTQTIVVGNNSNRALVVFATTKNNGATITGATFNGVSMTQIDTATQGSGGAVFHVYSFILLAPTVGSNTLTLTTSSGSCDLSYYSLYNVSQTSEPEAHNAWSLSSASGSESLSTVANGALMISCLFADGTTPSITGTAAYEHSQSPSGYVYSYDLSPVFPAATSVTMSFTGGTTNTTALLMLSLAPATVPSETVVPSSAANSTNQFVNKYTGYVGIAQSSASTGGTVTVATGGIDANQTGLIPGTQYYLGNSAGSFSTAAGTNTRKAGVAVSTTQMLITNIW